MKLRGLSNLQKPGMALCLCMVLQAAASAQCVNNLGTRTYDTTMTNTGYGLYSLSLPKWSPDSGILVSVKLSAEVSSLYNFTLRNADVQPTTFMLSVNQADQFTSDQLPSVYTGLTSQVIGTYPLASGQSVSQGPFLFLDKHITSDSITTVAPFLGQGQVNINYMSYTFTSLISYNNATYYYGAGMNNTVKFSLQYLYCKSGGVLAAELTRWTAALRSSRTVQLDWSAVNETAGRTYDIQRSYDNQTYTTIATQTAAADGAPSDYTYDDQLPETAAGEVYYRLQLHDEGKDSWSAIRQVVLTGNSTSRGMSIYPNPATDFINIIPPVRNGLGSNGDWQVDVLSASGGLVQRDTWLQSSSLRVAFRNKLSAGTYFVRLLDLRGQKSYVSSFIVAAGL
jgi:hypothetical protein